MRPPGFLGVKVAFLVPVTGLGLHFSFSGGERKIEVATSVCTGGSQCPPDTGIPMGSSPFPSTKKEDTHKGCLLFGAGDRTRFAFFFLRGEKEK